MTNEERIRAVIDCGFTERQARFLVLVMRHAGVCVPRQYAEFAGIANGGRRCNLFFDRLVTRRYAYEIRCVHNRARVYHVHHKQLYFMIGEGASRHRRPVSPRLTMERLMLLDAVRAIPDVDWLTTTAEKAAYLERLGGDTGVGVQQRASVDVVSATNSQSPSAFPIGLAPDGRAVLVYLASEPATERFRTFLQTHVALLRDAPSWTLRLVFPCPLDRVYGTYQAVVHEELESPLHAATIRELQWYFEHRANARERMHTQVHGLLERGATVFGTSRFTTMYQRWQKHGSAVFEGMSSRRSQKL